MNKQAATYGCLSGSAEMASLLISPDWTFDMSDVEDARYNLALAAIHGGNEDLMKSLVDKFPTLLEVPLQKEFKGMAGRWNAPEGAEFNLDYDGQANKTELPALPTGSLMSFACSKGRVDLYEYLIAKGCSTSIENLQECVNGGY